MNQKRKILLVCTGGTIASKQMEHGFAPGIGAEDILTYVTPVREKYEIDAIQVCNIDSTNMTPEHWTIIVDAITEHYDAYDGFVVCHGTDTMAYTSAELSYMIQNSVKPIVVTGAQKPIDLDITDAKTNLMDSILYAADENSHGVSIVFGGNVIAGTRAKKTRAQSFNAFSSVNFPSLAVIQNEKIIRYIPPETFAEPLQITHQVCDSIAVLKLIPSSKPELLEYMFRNYDCLVIESFGVGGIPERLLNEFYHQMNQWISKGKFVVMATQVVKEGSNMEVYEVGQKVKQDFNLIEAYDMTLEATITKLMYLMQRYGRDYDKIREGFYTTINFDILCV
jgi:L-asparaginase